MKFLSPEVALYLYKSNIWPCMKYCCHVWNDAPSCYLDLLDKLQKQIHSTVGLSLAYCLELLAHCQNVASLSLFFMYYFGRCSSELVQLVPLKKTLWPLFKDGVQLPQGYSHFEEAVYFLPLSSQKFLVLILPTSEG